MSGWKRKRKTEHNDNAQQENDEQRKASALLG
jgi:hypothetical protein